MMRLRLATLLALVAFGAEVFVSGQQRSEARKHKGRRKSTRANPIALQYKR